MDRRTLLKGAAALIAASSLQPLTFLPKSKEDRFTGKFEQVGDGMAPTVAGGDSVYFDTCDGYCGEGLYVIGDAESGVVYRVQRLRDTVHLRLDNKRYGGDHALSFDEFNSCLVGRVAGIFRPVNVAFL